MQFLRRNRYALLTVAVLILATMLVVQQYLTNESAHTRRVEDFLLLQENGDKESCEHLYQILVQQLPQLNDRSLVQDLLRTGFAVDPRTPQLDNLVWKYHVSVRNELRHRSEKRLQAVLQGAARQ